MEPNERIPQDCNSGKPSKAQVADLKETIVTGMGILKDAAGEESGENKQLMEAALEGVDVLCERALAGDLKAFSHLRDAAAKAMQGFSRVDARRRASKHRRTSKKKARRPGAKKTSLPERPLRFADMPDELPRISFDEVTRFLDARHAFLVARADYEQRRAALVYKLQMHCEPEDQSRTADYLLGLDADGDTINITDQGGGIPAENIIDRR